MWTQEMFGVEKPIIALLHLDALPGDPGYCGSMDTVLEHARQDLVALQNGGVDGILFANEFSLLFEELGVPPRRIITAGGGTKNAAWMQIICDMAGMPLTIPEPFQCSSYGDAMLAALGVGALESFAALRAALPQGRILQPDRKNHEFYQEHYPIFRDLYLENRDRMHRMQK